MSTPPPRPPSLPLSSPHSIPSSALSRKSARCCAFSLIELLVVIFVIALVLSILFPALAAARRSSRNGVTRNLMQNVKTAADQFARDQNRQPGFFSTRDMGDSENRQRGFSAMDNILLDLAGGTTEQTQNFSGDPCAIPGDRDIIEVGPSATTLIRVDLSAIGAGTSIAGVKKSSYLAVDSKSFVRQCIQGSKRATSVTPDHLALPALVDSFGSPILAWAGNETPGANPDFAAEDNSDKARFFHVSNHAFLEATGLGTIGADQTNREGGSMLSDNANASGVLQTMTALLGNPNSPDPNDPTKPTQARGRIIFHSAGSDGIYMGKRDRGGKSAAAAGAGKAINYSPSLDLFNDGSFDDLFETMP